MDPKGNEVDHVLVSQASRCDAKPVDHKVNGYESYLEEHEALCRRKLELDEQLGGYSKAQMIKRQAEIRREGGNTLQRWLKEKVRLEEERKVLVDEARGIVTRLMEIKPRLRYERIELEKAKQRREGRAKERNIQFDEMITLLTEIRDLLTKAPQ